MDTSLYLLCMKKVGFTVLDLNEISIGLALDTVITQSDDYAREATQDDYDNF